MEIVTTGLAVEAVAAMIVVRIVVAPEETAVAVADHLVVQMDRPVVLV